MCLIWNNFTAIFYASQQNCFIIIVFWYLINPINFCFSDGNCDLYNFFISSQAGLNSVANPITIYVPEDTDLAYGSQVDSGTPFNGFVENQR